MNPATAAPDYILTVVCPDRPGIVHAVSGSLFEHGGNILESQQFDDVGEGRFFMRVRFGCDPAMGLEQLRRGFEPVAARFGMSWHLWDAAVPHRTLILVSKFGHCLNDLLFRWSQRALKADIVGVVSNHPDLEPMVRSYGVPFHHIAVTPATKPQAERAMLDLAESLGVHLVVLARYMQVLSQDACRALSGRAINIHHSFLPSFKGGRPYQQAFDSGVKLVGATAHYVTAELDEGPIIEQDTVRVDHRSD
ncbi:MAG: formyltetrahydrofolate deformylase, partial [Microlunatus sp.]|nr:formyltetrahydrofolate deformylase [Microlunatus sp.]